MKIKFLALAMVLTAIIFPCQAKAQDIPSWLSYEHCENAAPLLPSVIFRPPVLAPGDNLTLTVTDVYDVIGMSDTMLQSSRWIYMAPTGTVQFNQNMVITIYDPYTTSIVHVLDVSAGEVFSVWGLGSHNLIFHQLYFPVYCCHFDYASGVYGTREFSIRVRYPTTAPQRAVWVQGRLSYHDITPLNIRVFRFEIGSLIYTDNELPRTLEAAPFIADDRVMVPFRVIVGSMGAANLDFTDGVVSFTLFGETISMTIGEPLGTMGTPVIINDRTFVPLAFVVHGIGAQARWDSEFRAAYVYID